MRKPHPHPKRDAAIAWLASQSWFADWREVPRYPRSDAPGNRRVSPEWRQVADAVRNAGFFSLNTATLDLPVADIVAKAMAKRDVGRR